MKLEMYGYCDQEIYFFRKSKMEESLLKQKQELKVILKEYIDFIDKILIDKKKLKT